MSDKHYSSVEITIDNQCFYIFVNGKPYSHHNSQKAADAVLDDFFEQYAD